MFGVGCSDRGTADVAVFRTSIPPGTVSRLTEVETTRAESTLVTIVPTLIDGLATIDAVNPDRVVTLADTVGRGMTCAAIVGRRLIE